MNIEAPEQKEKLLTSAEQGFVKSFLKRDIQLFMRR